MDVLLINPFPEFAYGTNETTVEPPLGLGYLGSITERKGLSCRIIDANVLQIKTEELLKQIYLIKPKILGISVNLYTYKTALKITDRVKKKIPETTIILGGPTPTSTPKKTMEECQADAVCIGEGEETFSEILERYESGKNLFYQVKGIMYRKGKKIIQNSPRGFMQDINKLPFPAYHMFPNLMKYKSRAIKKPFAPLLTSRGCPFQCVFCSKDVFKYVCRMRSPENVIEEIDLLVNNYGVKQIDILDDNFTLDKERTKKILDLIISRKYDLCINLQSGVRTEGIDKAVINKMKKAKIFKIPFGVESGDENILNIIRKQLDLKRVIKCTKLAKEAGMKVYGFFIIGLPGDTPETMQKTIDFAIKMNPNIANFAIAIPFPGTELYRMVEKDGKFLVNMDDGIDAGFYANEVFYELEGMDRNQVLKYYKKAMKKFYLRPQKIYELLSGMKSISELEWFLSTSVNIFKKVVKA